MRLQPIFDKPLIKRTFKAANLKGIVNDISRNVEKLVTILAPRKGPKIGCPRNGVHTVTGRRTVTTGLSMGRYKLRPAIISQQIAYSYGAQTLFIFRHIQVDVGATMVVDRPTTPVGIVTQLVNLLKTTITLQDGRIELSPRNAKIAFSAESRLSLNGAGVPTFRSFDFNAVPALTRTFGKTDAMGICPRPPRCLTATTIFPATITTGTDARKLALIVNGIPSPAPDTPEELPVVTTSAEAIAERYISQRVATGVQNMPTAPAPTDV